MYYIVQWALLPELEIEILFASVEKLPKARGAGFINLKRFNHIYFSYSEWDRPPEVIIDKDNVEIDWSIETSTDWIFGTEEEAFDKFYSLVKEDKKDLFNELIFKYKKRRT